MKIENADIEDEEAYVSIDDDEILDNVFRIFKERFSDTYNFGD